VHDEAGGLPLDLFTVGRWLAYAAAATAVGAVVFAVVLRRSRSQDTSFPLADQIGQRAWRIALAVPAALLLAHLLRLYGQVNSFLEPGDQLTWQAVRPILLSTSWGRGWLAQFAAALIAGLAFLLASAGSSAKVAGLGAVAVAAASPLTGHAVEHPWGATAGVILHTLHLLGVGTWLGTLFVLFLAGFYGLTQGGALEGPEFLARLVRQFSPFALGGAGVAVAAGGLLGLAYVGSLHALWSTTYGQVLLVKGGLLLGVAALGGYNWQKVTPKLGTLAGSSTFRRSAAAELTLGALMLAATAVLVALPAPKI